MKGRKGRKERNQAGSLPGHSIGVKWVEGMLVAVTPDHVAKNALRVTVVGSLGTDGRKSIERSGMAGAGNWMYERNGGLGLSGFVWLSMRGRGS